MTAIAQPVDLRDRVPADEWQMRVDLAAAYRLVAHYGWDDLIFTHISARVPNTDHHFLINPYGQLFEEITASSLVKVDLEGNKLDETPFPVNPAGFTIHSAVHAAREEAACVMHLHTVAGVAVSGQKEGLLPINQTAMILNGQVAFHEYEGIALDHDERPRLVADLGDKNAMLLWNHGTLTVGTSIPDAFLLMYFFERACATQIATLAGGGELHWPADRVQEVVRRQAQGGTGPVAKLAWDGLLRMLDRKDPSYKT
ncbi:MAG TPA: class II aldolase/adducin family protein [Candidatus Elarobacter sp.]|jgi:ribulose-5-phosphate 4-epimerase/fuculose-1-phosphate aldolase